MTKEIIDLTGDSSDDDYQTVTKDSTVVKLEVNEFIAEISSELKQKSNSTATVTQSKDNVNPEESSHEVLVPVGHKSRTWEQISPSTDNVVDTKSSVLTPKRGADIMNDILTTKKKTRKSLFSELV